MAPASPAMAVGPDHHPPLARSGAMAEGPEPGPGLLWPGGRAGPDARKTCRRCGAALPPGTPQFPVAGVGRMHFECAQAFCAEAGVALEKPVCKHWRDRGCGARQPPLHLLGQSQRDRPISSSFLRAAWMHVKSPDTWIEAMAR